MEVVTVRSMCLFFAGVSLCASGCGSVAKFSGKSRSASSASPSAGVVVASFVATADPRSGRILFRPEGHGVQAQATAYGGGDDISLSGAAVYDPGTASLSGNVSVSSANVVPFYDLRVLVTQVSNSSVSAANADGVTTLTGSSAPFWKYGTVSQGTPGTRNWRFNVPSGDSFTFRAQVWANVWKYSTGDGGTLQSVCFVSRTHGWTVGGAGKILCTTDGATWSSQAPNVSQPLNGVSFVDDSYGWAVGGSGMILATTNGGRTWRQQDWRTQPQDFSTTLHAVRFATRSVGWVVGDAGLVLRTTNGGLSWSRVTLGIGDTLYALDNVGTTQVWVAGAGPSIFYSGSGGVNWVSQAVPSGGTLASLIGVDFADPNIGIAVGPLGTAFRTVNGGQTWTAIDCGVGTANLQAVKFATPSEVFIVGQGGLGRRSLDGGLTWGAIDTGASTDLTAIDCADADYGWMVGRSGTIVRATDGSAPAGGTWSAVTRSASFSLNGLDFLPNGEGWAVGTLGTALRTSDGGRTWQPAASGSSHTLTGVKLQSIAGGTRTWIVGGSGTLSYSDDGGVSWTSPPISGTSGTFTLADIDFANSLIGLACGSGGVLLRTGDGGATWQKVNSGTTQSLNALSFVDASRAWVVGTAGATLYTADGGLTWTGLSSPVGDSLTGVKAVDADHVWMCGQTGRILAVTGWTGSDPVWSVQDSTSSATLNSIDFTDTLNGWAAGSNGTLVRTLDGGVTWTSAPSGTTQSINAVLFRDPDDAWIVGAAGLVQRFH